MIAVAPVLHHRQNADDDKSRSEFLSYVLLQLKADRAESPLPVCRERELPDPWERMRRTVAHTWWYISCDVAINGIETSIDSSSTMSRIGGTNSRESSGTTGRDNHSHVAGYLFAA